MAQRFALETTMLTEGQRLERRKGIGASEVGVLFGVDPYRTPFDLWAIKTGKYDPPDAGDAAEIGSECEDAIIRLAARRLGVKAVKATSTFVRGYLRANLDAMIGKAQRGAPVIEAKMTSVSDGWGAPGSDEVPPRVALQVQAQMLAAESDFAHVARLLVAFGAQFDLFGVPACKDTQFEIEHRIDEFWTKHVLADVPPPNAMPSLEVMGNWKRTAGPIAVLTDEVVTHERECKEALDAAEAEHGRAKAALLRALGDSEVGESSKWAVSFKEVRVSRIDGDALKERFPDVAAQVTKGTAHRRLLVKQRKGKPE